MQQNKMSNSTKVKFFSFCTSVQQWLVEFWSIYGYSRSTEFDLMIDFFQMEMLEKCCRSPAAARVSVFWQQNTRAQHPLMNGVIRVYVIQLKHTPMNEKHNFIMELASKKYCNAAENFAELMIISLMIVQVCCKFPMWKWRHCFPFQSSIWWWPCCLQYQGASKLGKGRTQTRAAFSQRTALWDPHPGYTTWLQSMYSL